MRKELAIVVALGLTTSGCWPRPGAVEIKGSMQVAGDSPPLPAPPPPLLDGPQRKQVDELAICLKESDKEIESWTWNPTLEFSTTVTQPSADTLAIEVDGEWRVRLTRGNTRIWCSIELTAGQKNRVVVSTECHHTHGHHGTHRFGFHHHHPYDATTDHEDPKLARKEHEGESCVDTTRVFEKLIVTCLPGDDWELRRSRAPAESLRVAAIVRE